MPVAAARLADVGAADPQPAIGGGVGQHRGEERAVGLLHVGALGKRAARVGGAAGKRITNLLELTEVEHPRRTRGGDPVRHVDAPETLRDQPGKLALEPPDLPPQLGPRTGLAKQPVVLGNPLGDKGQPVELRSRSPVEKIRHSQILSGLEGRCSNP